MYKSEKESLQESIRGARLMQQQPPYFLFDRSMSDCFCHIHGVLASTSVSAIPAEAPALGPKRGLAKAEDPMIGWGAPEWGENWLCARVLPG